jgi:uncharacterized protein DUF4043
MAETVMSTAERVKQWDDKFFMEYVRDSRFMRYMGSDENAIIQVNNDLTKEKGDAITFNLIGALDASAGPNDGSTSLVGAEKELPNDGHQLRIAVVRDAVVVNLKEQQAAPIDVRNAGRVALKKLSMRYLKEDIVTALGTIFGTVYGSASATQKNNWNVANVDRVLFGDSIANYNATHATALANITAGMKLTRAVVSLAKEIATTAVTVNGEGITPYTYGEDEETYVMFAGVGPYRDLKTDLETVHQEARERALTNPLFTGTTSLYWDGVVIRQIPEIDNIGLVGAGGTVTVSPVYLCGAQALGVGWAQTTKSTTRKEDDYGYRQGVGFFEMRGVEKLLWNQSSSTAAIDWSVVTIFVSDPPTS